MEKIHTHVIIFFLIMFLFGIIFGVFMIWNQIMGFYLGRAFALTIASVGTYSLFHVILYNILSRSFTRR